jgi:outer membrane lipoprotein-sorting protein
MNRKKVALSAAATGVVAGVVGLGLLALPAGANEAPPELPAITAEALVESVATATMPAGDGKVEVAENLGLPVKLLPQGAAGASVASDGQGRVRATLPGKTSEQTVIEDGSTLWLWNSAEQKVTKIPHGDRKPGEHDAKLGNPAEMAKDVVAKAREFSEVKVDGTAMVANRPAYQLLLTPKPTERTLLREVRVAVDSETRIPLRLEVLANAQPEPALKLGFTEFNVRPQDPAQFTFTPPAGAEVTERQPGDKAKAEGREHAEGFGRLLGQLSPQIIGDGWDTVAVLKVPAEASGMLNGQAQGDRPGAGGPEGNPLEMLRGFGKEIDTPFGKAWVFGTKVGTAILTGDGRAAVGLVPEQVLIEALGQAK